MFPYGQRLVKLLFSIDYFDHVLSGIGRRNNKAPLCDEIHNSLAKEINSHLPEHVFYLPDLQVIGLVIMLGDFMHYYCVQWCDWQDTFYWIPSSIFKKNYLLKEITLVFFLNLGAPRLFEVFQFTFASAFASRRLCWDIFYMPLIKYEKIPSL